MNTQLTTMILSTAIALAIVACGGSGTAGFAGIGGSGFISSGSISGFGSVFVNGVEFETDSATFDIDGDSGTQDDLAIGMVVQVSGTINEDGVTGTATSISFDDELQGPVAVVSAPDLDGIKRSLTILGITVIIDSSSTTFDIDNDNLPADFGFDTIAVNNNVEVSGFFSNNGTLQATRVELKDIDFGTNSIVEVKGIINDLTGTTFTLQGLTVDASLANLDNLSNGLEDSQLVEVKGTFNTVSKTITATKVEAEDYSIDDTNEFELEGLITDFDGSRIFKIDGIIVDASNATFEPTSLILENDLRVEAEGPIVNGILVAEEIELEAGDLKVHAMVTAVPPITNPNTFEVSPVSGESAITVTVTTGTQLEDDVGESDQFTLDNLNDTHFVEVRGYDDGNGGITATEVDIKEPGDIVVQGYATDADGSSVGGGTMTVLGVTFTFDEFTDFEIDSDESAEDTNMTESEINGLIDDIQVEPQLVSIEDKSSEGILGVADEIEIESL